MLQLKKFPWSYCHQIWSITLVLQSLPSSYNNCQLSPVTTTPFPRLYTVYRMDEVLMRSQLSLICPTCPTLLATNPSNSLPFTSLLSSSNTQWSFSALSLSHIECLNPTHASKIHTRNSQLLRNIILGCGLHSPPSPLNDSSLDSKCSFKNLLQVSRAEGQTKYPRGRDWDQCFFPKFLQHSLWCPLPKNHQEHTCSQ